MEPSESDNKGETTKHKDPPEANETESQNETAEEAKILEQAACTIDDEAVPEKMPKNSSPFYSDVTVAKETNVYASKYKFVPLPSTGAIPKTSRTKKPRETAKSNSFSPNHLHSSDFLSDHTSNMQDSESAGQFEQGRDHSKDDAEFGWSEDLQDLYEFDSLPDESANIGLEVVVAAEGGEASEFNLETTFGDSYAASTAMEEYTEWLLSLGKEINIPVTELPKLDFQSASSDQSLDCSGYANSEPTDFIEQEDCVDPDSLKEAKKCMKMKSKSISRKRKNARDKSALKQMVRKNLDEWQITDYQLAQDGSYIDERRNVLRTFRRHFKELRRIEANEERRLREINNALQSSLENLNRELQDSLETVRTERVRAPESDVPAGQRSCRVAESDVPAGQRSCRVAESDVPAGQRSCRVAESDVHAGQQSCRVAENLSPAEERRPVGDSAAVNSESVSNNVPVIICLDHRGNLRPGVVLNERIMRNAILVFPTIKARCILEVKRIRKLVFLIISKLELLFRQMCYNTMMSQNLRKTSHRCKSLVLVEAYRLRQESARLATHFNELIQVEMYLRARVRAVEISHVQWARFQAFCQRQLNLRNANVNAIVPGPSCNETSESISRSVPCSNKTSDSIPASGSCCKETCNDISETRPSDNKTYYPNPKFHASSTGEKPAPPHMGMSVDRQFTYDQEPMASDSQSFVHNQQSMVTDSEPLMHDQESMVADSEPLIHDQESMVADSEPLMHDQESMVADSEPLMHDQESMVADSEPLIHDQESMVADSEPLMHDQESMVANNEPLIHDQESMVAGSEPLMHEQEPMVSDSETLVRDQESAVCNNESSAHDSESGMSIDEPSVQ